MDIANKRKEYDTDTHLVYSCQYHVIFCTKYRRKVIDETIGNRFLEIVEAVAVKNNFKVLEAETMPDHIHLLLSVNPRFGVHKAVSLIKGKTSNVLRNEFPSLRSRLSCLWTRAKFISSVGEVSLDVVKKYIESQKHA